MQRDADNEAGSALWNFLSRAICTSGALLGNVMRWQHGEAALQNKGQMMGTNTELYNADFYAWCLTTATLIREGKWYDIDREALAEEIESVGRSQKRELESRIHVLVMHLLKWRYQPEGRQHGHSWRSTIRTQRRELRLLLRDNPSLSPQLPTVVRESYPDARIDALDETGLPEAALPHDCPWTVVQILDDGFWPDMA